MHKLFIVMLLASITSQGLAQNSEEIFDIPASKINRKFIIELGNSDKMQIELSSMNDLSSLQNTDSLIAVFLNNIRYLKDSVKPGIASIRIDYLVDTSTQKKIRIRKLNPAASHFLVSNEEAALLKLEQDTIAFVGRIQMKNHPGIRSKRLEYHYYRLSFFLNDLNDLALYVDGKINSKIKALEAKDLSWQYKNGIAYLKQDNDIKAPAVNGLLQTTRTFNLRLSVNAQNYKNEFVPSSSWGIVYLASKNIVTQKFGVQFENHFLFARGTNGKLKTYTNEFITVSYEREFVDLDQIRNYNKITPSISLSYLLHQSGDFYDKSTFRLGLGRYAPFGGSLRIEPSFYFHDFFKGVTPSLRITQYF